MASSVQPECFMLCDYARTENGKLYIVGGGWNDIVLPAFPFEYSAYLAIKMVLPGTVLVTSHFVRIELLDKSGHVLGEPVFETRLQALANASTDGTGEGESGAVLLMSVAVQMVLAAPGSFVLRLVVNDVAIAETNLTVALDVPG